MKTMKREFNSNRGMALVITLVIVTILTTLLVELTYSTQANVRMATTYRDDLKAYYIAKSGVELAIALLAKDREEDREKPDQGEKPTDNLDELWANLSLSVAGIQATETKPFGDGILGLRIIDEDRKINVNTILEEPFFSIFERLFADVADEEGSSDFRDAIKDWIDPDDEETDPGGAESLYYTGLDIPYPCKNAPMDTISELRMVKGSEEAMKVVFEVPEDEENETPEKLTLEDVLSAIPDAKHHTININTAPAPVLRALHEDMDGNPLMETLPNREFGSKADFLEYLNANFGITGLPDKVLDVKSHYFTIESTGVVGEIEKNLRVTVYRTDSDIKVISWRVE
jgi:general secretion pathway protein K